MNNYNNHFKTRSMHDQPSLLQQYNIANTGIDDVLYEKDIAMNNQSDLQQYNIANSGIDNVLYQKVVKRLNCPEDEQRYIVPPLKNNDPDNYFQDILETYNINTLYSSHNYWVFWFILALAILLLYLLYKYVYTKPTLSPETIRATILGYSP